MLPGTGDSVLVFLPGFMASAASYRELLAPLAVAGTTVLIPQLYRRGLAALAGRPTAADEAVQATLVVRGAAARYGSRRVFLGGHSRGGQAAWRAAPLLEPDGLPAGLVLLDPVDGSGPLQRSPHAAATRTGVTCPTLVVGAGVSGRCAPEGLNHRAFASAAPHVHHAVVDGLGHADVLTGAGRTLGRLLCGGGADPERARAQVCELVRSFIDGCLQASESRPSAATA